MEEKSDSSLRSHETEYLLGERKETDEV